MVKGDSGLPRSHRSDAQHTEHEDGRVNTCVPGSPGCAVRVGGQREIAASGSASGITLGSWNVLESEDLGSEMIACCAALFHKVMLVTAGLLGPASVLLWTARSDAARRSGVACSMWLAGFVDRMAVQLRSRCCCLMLSGCIGFVGTVVVRTGFAT